MASFSTSSGVATQERKARRAPKLEQSEKSKCRKQKKVRAGDNLTIEFAQIGLSLLAKPTTSTDDVLELQRYVAATPELSVTHGVQQPAPTGSRRL